MQKKLHLQNKISSYIRRFYLSNIAYKICGLLARVIWKTLSISTSHFKFISLTWENQMMCKNHLAYLKNLLQDRNNCLKVDFATESYYLIIDTSLDFHISHSATYRTIRSSANSKYLKKKTSWKSLRDPNIIGCNETNATCPTNLNINELRFLKKRYSIWTARMGGGIIAYSMQRTWLCSKRKSGSSYVIMWTGLV